MRYIVCGSSKLAGATGRHVLQVFLNRSNRAHCPEDIMQLKRDNQQYAVTIKLT